MGLYLNNCILPFHNEPQPPPQKKGGGEKEKRRKIEIQRSRGEQNVGQIVFQNSRIATYVSVCMIT